MPTDILKYSTIGLAALTSAAQAQDFYVGAALSSGDWDLFPGSERGSTETLSTTLVFAGARVDVGQGFFIGGELQSSRGTGYDDAYWAFDDGTAQSINQAELHFGYKVGSTTLFGFVGEGSNGFTDNEAISSSDGPTVRGVGAEIGVADNIAVRVEAEMGKLSFTDPCGTYDPEVNSFSAGVIFSF